jgi:hypothetical protein
VIVHISTPIALDEEVYVESLSNNFIEGMSNHTPCLCLCFSVRGSAILKGREGPKASPPDTETFGNKWNKLIRLWPAKVSEQIDYSIIGEKRVYLRSTTNTSQYHFLTLFGVIYHI